jgi:undecaprenyl pyrophosphate phosphatase UppP
MLLFVWILFRSTLVSLRDAWNKDQESERQQTKRIIAALMCALVLNSVFGLTFTLYSIAPLVWLFMGWISVESLKKRESEREVITI